MVRTRLAGTRLLLLGLAAAAVAAGSAAAALPALKFAVHARLAPVAGTDATGRFGGLLVKSGDAVRPQAPNLPVWRLSWKLSLPALPGSATASLRIPAGDGAPRFVHVLCTSCTSTATGTFGLTGSQALRLAQSRATVVVAAQSATLRGAVKARAVVLPPRR